MTGDVVRILEPRAGGHRLWYVRLVVDAAPDRCTLVTTADSARSTEFGQHLGGSRMATELIDLSSSGMRRWFSAALARATSASGSVLIPDAEAALRSLLTARMDRSKAVTAVLMRMNRGVGLRGSVAFAVRLLLAAALRIRWRGRLRLLALVPAKTTNRISLRLLGVDLLHDPVRFQPVTTDAEAARRHLGLPVDVPIFSVLGPLSGRKCVPELIAAWVTGGPPGLLLLAGTAWPEVMDALRRAPESSRSRVVLRDDYLDDQDFDTYLAASDVAVLLYRNRGSSGVLGKALAADCDVITSTITPAIPPAPGRRVLRVRDLTVDRIRAALQTWPGQRDRYPLRADTTANFTETVLADPV